MSGVRILEYTVTRDVTTTECPWLEADVPKGTVVYQCWKPQYGCVSGEGEAVTYDPRGDYPFFELPLTALWAV